MCAISRCTRGDVHIIVGTTKVYGRVAFGTLFTPSSDSACVVEPGSNQASGGLVTILTNLLRIFPLNCSRLLSSPALTSGAMPA
jgi:hypothetical protein